MNDNQVCWRELLKEKSRENCNVYCGVELIRHAMKSVERVLKRRI